MASKLEQTFPLKLLVDRKKSCVVMAEASKYFIETLFSFLTLPLGTIIRLLSKNKLNGDQEAKVGCITNLYNSVENATDEVFWNPICKQMLLRPQNPCEALCRKLKLNVDDNEPTRRFICSNYCKISNSLLLSAFSGVTCIKCGNPMDKEPKIMVNDSSSKVTHRHEDGVFVKGEAMYLIFDNLKVLQSSPRIFVKELVQLGYKDFNNLSEIYQNVGLKEVLDLLKQALTSKTALSDVFFANGFSKAMSTYSPKIGQTINHGRSDYYRNLKVTVSKSKKKILHAEAEEDFVDFLLSFLTAPLGSVLNVLDGNSSLGCMDNLYDSVKDLNSSWFFTSKIVTIHPLLNPHVAPQFCFRKWQPLQFRGNPACQYKYDDISGVLIPKLLIDINTTFYEPRSPNGQKEVGFVRRPSVFVVWDDLHVIPMANASSISFMQKMNIPFDDLEEHVIRIGSAEALNLLGASLTTNAALTEGLFYLLETPNQDARA